MKKLATAGGLIVLAFTIAGCSETLKEWLMRVTPVVACQKAEREHADWVAKGKPIERGGAAEKAAARKIIDAAYARTRAECAERGIVIN